MAISAAIACNAISGVEGLSVDDGPGAATGSNTTSGVAEAPTGSSSGTSGSSASSSGGSSSGTTSSASSTSSSSGEPDTGPSAIHETFSLESACATAKATNGATLSWVAAGGRAGGACQLCATQAGDAYLTVSGEVPSAGMMGVEAWVKRPDDRTTPTNVSLRVVMGGANVSTSGSLGNDWVRVGGARFGVNGAETVAVSGGIAAAVAGDCIIVDDVRAPIE